MGGFKLNTLTLDLDVIVDFIHWSQSVSLRLWLRGDIFSQRAALRCKQEMSALPQSKSLSLCRHAALSCPRLSSLCSLHQSRTP